jgi:hypothetical protein
VDASFYVRTRLPILQQFMNSLSLLEPGLEQDHQIEQAERVLSELAKFCSNSLMSTPIQEHQALLAETEPLQLFTGILKTLPQPSSLPQV